MFSFVTNISLMKNIFIILCLCFSFSLIAQEQEFKSTKQLNSWSIGSDLEFIQFYGDIKEYDWYPAKIKGSFGELRIGGNINITKMINNNYCFSS